jgi:hypothetical protein
MKASELAAFLKFNIEAHGDFEVVCPGDHQMLYKVRGVEPAYVEDIAEYQLEEVHVDDVQDNIEEGGNPIKVLAIYG